MSNTAEPAVHVSLVPFDENRIHAAAVYCSDGRFGKQFDDFLHNALKLPRYDRLAVPGGGACLAGHFLSHREEEAVFEQLRFLLKVHGLERVVLIAHQDCAYYGQRLNVSPIHMERQQLEDLRIAADRIHSLARDLTVETYFARRRGDAVVFEALGKPLSAVRASYGESLNG